MTVSSAYDGVLEAWAEAARQWKKAGCPSLAETNVREFRVGLGELVS